MCQDDGEMLYMLSLGIGEVFTIPQLCKYLL